VEHLVEQGIAVRSQNPNDRRSTLLSLTDRGREMVRDELAILDSTLEAMEDVDADAATSSAALLAAIAGRLRPGDS
jgi:DNA-binding MarR family transcriptional regulator